MNLLQRFSGGKGSKEAPSEDYGAHLLLPHEYADEEAVADLDGPRGPSQVYGALEASEQQLIWSFSRCFRGPEVINWARIRCQRLCGERPMVLVAWRCGS